MEEFLYPEGEEIRDSIEECDILDNIVNRYAGQEVGEPELVDKDKDGIEEEIEQKIPDSQAIEVIQVLHQYLQQKDTRYSLLEKELNILVEDIEKARIQGQKQANITQFFT
jgi:hypothetical protein